MSDESGPVSEAESVFALLRGTGQALPKGLVVRFEEAADATRDAMASLPDDVSEFYRQNRERLLDQFTPQIALAAVDVRGWHRDKTIEAMERAVVFITEVSEAVPAGREREVWGPQGLFCASAAGAAHLTSMRAMPKETMVDVLLAVLAAIVVGVGLAMSEPTEIEIALIAGTGLMMAILKALHDARKRDHQRITELAHAICLGVGDRRSARLIKLGLSPSGTMEDG